MNRVELSRKGLKNMINEAVKKKLSERNIMLRKKSVKTITESDLHNMVRNSVKRLLRESQAQFFVADEGDGNYNVFSYDDFDEDGYYTGYSGEEGYHIDDFDIVYTTNDCDDAFKWIERENGYEDDDDF